LATRRDGPRTGSSPAPGRCRFRHISPPVVAIDNHERRGSGRTARPLAAQRQPQSRGSNSPSAMMKKLSVRRSARGCSAHDRRLRGRNPAEASGRGKAGPANGRCNQQISRVSTARHGRSYRAGTAPAIHGPPRTRRAPEQRPARVLSALQLVATEGQTREEQSRAPTLGSATYAPGPKARPRPTETPRQAWPPSPGCRPGCAMTTSCTAVRRGSSRSVIQARAEPRRNHTASSSYQRSWNPTAPPKVPAISAPARELEECDDKTSGRRTVPGTSRAACGSPGLRSNSPPLLLVRHIGSPRSAGFVTSIEAVVPRHRACGVATRHGRRVHRPAVVAPTLEDRGPPGENPRMSVRVRPFRDRRGVPHRPECKPLASTTGGTIDPRRGYGKPGADAAKANARRSTG